MSTPKEWRHMHGASGLNFDLTELRKRYADCVRFKHLPELKRAREFYESILDEVEGGNYKKMYDGAAHSVTEHDIEIDRLQRAIFENLPLEKAVEIIDAAPMPHGRMIIRDKEAVKLKQELEVAREARDKLVAQKQNEFVVQWAYRITSAQGSVDQAKKALYMHLRANRKNSMIPGGHDVKHKDL